MDLLPETPALARLRWLLTGLDGGWTGGPEAVADALAPGFAAVVPPALLWERTAERAGRLAPVRVSGVDAGRDAATARFRTRDGDLWVSHVEVEPAAPHRITLTYTAPWVPDYLAPRLPDEFAVPVWSAPPTRPTAPAPGGVLVAFGGVPGSGKSTVSEAVGTALDIPVFSADWLLGALTRFGDRHRLDLLAVGEELLTTLAYRELRAGRSAILDTTAEDPSTRRRWASMAAAFVPVVCVCADPVRHRERVEKRVRGIPGWADAGDWTDASARLAAFPPWAGALVVDTTKPLEECVGTVVGRIRETRPPTPAG